MAHQGQVPIACGVPRDILARGQCALQAIERVDPLLRRGPATAAPVAKRLLATVRNGKTGFRVANSMSGAVARYQRLRQRYPDAGGEDFIFLPHHTNRATVARIFARQFNVLLDETGLKHDPVTDTERSVYCPRHTAICMRIILSHGNVNIFNLAKNAGTGVQAD